MIKTAVRLSQLFWYAHSFNLLAELERRMGRDEREAHYKNIANLLGSSVAKPLPMGYWDEANNRFVDWVDRNGDSHDHIHLLANILPVLFGHTSEAQEESILALVDEHIHQFQRFPTFLAAHIDQYTDSEIGDGGPYDLCAAGRYWCWDAAFWSWKKNRNVFARTINASGRIAATEGYVMGERYDMNYIYYLDDKIGMVRRIIMNILVCIHGFLSMNSLVFVRRLKLTCKSLHD